MEEVLYDTGVLFAEFRRGVRVLMGFTTILNVIEFPKALQFNGLRIIYPSPEDYRVALEICRGLIEAGRPVPAVDIVVAAVAISRGLTLKSRDRHFEFIRAVRSDLKLELI